MVLAACGAPGGEPELAVGADAYDGERAVGPFAGEARDAFVERDALVEIVDLQDPVVEGWHRAGRRNEAWA
jgi:hypothetical protein